MESILFLKIELLLKYIDIFITNMNILIFGYISIVDYGVFTAWNILFTN